MLGDRCTTVVIEYDTSIKVRCECISLCGRGEKKIVCCRCVRAMDNERDVWDAFLGEEIQTESRKEQVCRCCLNSCGAHGCSSSAYLCPRSRRSDTGCTESDPTAV